VLQCCCSALQAAVKQTLQLTHTAATANRLTYLLMLLWMLQLGHLLPSAALHDTSTQR
jgi:hypothetical protein